MQKSITLFFSLLWIAIAILQIVYVVKYKDESSRKLCSDNTALEPWTILLIGGVLNLCAIFLPFLLLLIPVAASTIVLFTIFIFILALVRVIFTIVGAISIWKYNNDCKPEELKTVMWTVIISQSILFFITLIIILYGGRKVIKQMNNVHHLHRNHIHV